MCKKLFKHYNKDKDPDFRYVKNWRGDLIRVPKCENKYQERKYLGKFCCSCCMECRKGKNLYLLLHADYSGDKSH